MFYVGAGDRVWSLLCAPSLLLGIRFRRFSKERSSSIKYDIPHAAPHLPPCFTHYGFGRRDLYHVKHSTFLPRGKSTGYRGTRSVLQRRGAKGMYAQQRRNVSRIIAQRRKAGQIASCLQQQICLL